MSNAKELTITATPSIVLVVISYKLFTKEVSVPLGTTLELAVLTVWPLIKVPLAINLPPDVPASILKLRFVKAASCITLSCPASLLESKFLRIIVAKAPVDAPAEYVAGSWLPKIVNGVATSPSLIISSSIITPSLWEQTHSKLNVFVDPFSLTKWSVNLLTCCPVLSVRSVTKPPVKSISVMEATSNSTNSPFVDWAVPIATGVEASVWRPKKREYFFPE